jgi:hypothetical protein
MPPPSCVIGGIERRQLAIPPRRRGHRRKKMIMEKIVAVKNVALHCYDGTNCETAYYAKSDSRPGYRWYVGYGGNYLPASKADLDNMQEYAHQAAELEEGKSYFAGNCVMKYRTGNDY